MDKTDIFLKAEKKARKKKRFLLSLIFMLAVSALLIYIDLNYGWPKLTWAVFPIFGMGILVLFQGIFAFDFFGLGNKWEKEEILKEVEKRRKVLEAFEEEYGDIEELELEDLREIRKESKDIDFV